MPIRESGENYLETILMLQNKLGYVRSVDVANELDYSKASISRAMSILKDNDYINILETGQIILTPSGLSMANEIYERHRLITLFLMDTLGVDHDVADTDACRIEHIISKRCFEKIKEYVLARK